MGSNERVPFSRSEVEFRDVARATQRVLNAVVAAEAVPVADAHEATIFDEYVESSEELCVMLLRHNSENKRLLARLLKECAESVEEQL